MPMYDPKPLPRRALIAVTSAEKEFYENGKKTGVFITEAMHPYNVFRAANFEVDFVSETGSYTPDYLSTTDKYLSGQDKKDWEDKNSDFRKSLDSLQKAYDVDPDVYGIFFASAGHASLIDYPDAKGLQRLAGKIYSDGGIMSAVCHGAALFPGIESVVTNTPIIQGRKVTGFTTKGEEEAGVLDTIKSWKKPTIEEGAKDAGAEYVAPPTPWESFTVTDDRIVTGANPASAEDTAKAVVEAFEGHPNHAVQPKDNKPKPHD